MCRLSSSTRLLSALLSGAVHGCGVGFWFVGFFGFSLLSPSFMGFDVYYKNGQELAWGCTPWPRRGGESCSPLLGRFCTGLIKVLCVKPGETSGCSRVAGGGTQLMATWSHGTGSVHKVRPGPLSNFGQIPLPVNVHRLPFHQISFPFIPSRHFPWLPVSQGGESAAAGLCSGSCPSPRGREDARSARPPRPPPALP